MTTIAVLFLTTGLLVLLVSLPLVFRKVPMNRFYGIRLARAFESEQHWYDINAYGGRQMAVWSWLIIATGAAGFLIPEQYEFAYAISGTALILLAILIPVIRICIWSKNYSASFKK